MVDEKKEVVIDVSVVGVDAAERAMRRVHRAARGDIDWVYVAWLSVLMFLASFFGATAARAEDMHDIRGTKHGCVDFSVTNAAWTTYTSASLENMQGSTALAASLYWTQIQIINGDGPVYVCEAAAASCGADSTHKLQVATGAASIDPARGLSIQSVSLTGAGLAATTGQLCGYFRSAP